MLVMHLSLLDTEKQREHRSIPIQGGRSMPRIQNSPRSSHRTAALFGIGCVMGVLAFLLIYGLFPLDMTCDVWCRGGFVERDVQQHYAGWLFYRSSPLAFPFCTPQNINWPQGISILYTDSIPLFAVFFRLLSPLLPATFQYFGWFALFCFALQGGFAALLLGLFLSDNSTVLLGVLPFIFSPVLVERAFRHTALGAQFLILAALWYYFKGHQENRFAYKGLFALNCLAVGLHPYFVPMTFAITLALLAEWGVRNRRWKKPAVYLAANLAATVAFGAALGLFTASGNGGSAAPYGYFGMNLNALWNPVSCGNTVWSRFLPVQNQVRGNYDAFNYLGLGILLVCAAAAVCCVVQRQWATVIRWLLQHWMLILCCLALSVFAVSNVVTANGATIITVPLPLFLIRLATTFRSSGRMFWPVYYLLFLGGVLFLARSAELLGGALAGHKAGGAPIGSARHPSLDSAAAKAERTGQDPAVSAAPVASRILCRAALLVLAAVQLWDISPALSARHNAFAQYEPAFPSRLTSPFWEEAGCRYRHIVALDDAQTDSLHLALFAADHGMTTNDPFAARYDEAGLNARREEQIGRLRAGEADPDCLYLIHEEGLFLDLADRMGNDIFCACLEGGWYILAPGMAYNGSDALVFSEEYPLRLMASYTDSYWENGILVRAPSEEWVDKAGRTILFTDCAFLRRRLECAGALRDADGQAYAILAVDDRDAGYLMVTLDIPDANTLIGVDLEPVK